MLSSQVLRLCSSWLIALPLLASFVCAEEGPIPAAENAPSASAATPAATEASDAQKSSLNTAVALNYCRASFHRIRKHQTEDVLLEEQEKILNNLNLGQVNDAEVIALYTSVLDEISQIGLADKERVMFQTNHVAQVRRQVTWDALAFGTDLMTAQFGSAVKTGANSWWDYRNRVYQRDMDLHKIEKTRVTTVVQRSSQFLDTFWKLARKKNIPDRWLVRGDDLDQLEAAMQEKDPEVRLRVLRRMEPFMEAYPPYWYYVGRTQQELGKLSEAISIYGKLEGLGTGYFRKDELLATAMANQAAIQDYLGDSSAIASAHKALNYSTDVWEANLMAARVLQRRGQVADAEDAILRNLDVNLEQSQSHVFLASLYFFTKEDKKLLAMLNDPQAVAHLPAPVLLRCAAMVGVEKVPPLVVNNILASLEAFPRNGLGQDQVTVRVGYAWQLHLARLEAWQDGKRLSDPQVAQGKGYHDLRFAVNSDRTFSLAPSSASRKELQLVLTYPDQTVVRLTLGDLGATEGRSASPAIALGGNLSSATSMRISNIRVGEETFALRAREANRSTENRVRAAKPISDETSDRG